MAGPGFFRTLGRVYGHSSLLEWRSPVGLISSLLFAIIMGTVYHFAMHERAFDLLANVNGVMLATLFFGSTILAARSSQGESEGGALRAVLMAPCDPSGYYLGRVLSLWQIQLFLVLIYIPLFGTLLRGGPEFEWQRYTITFFVLGLSALSLSALGVLLGHISRRNRLRDLLIPLIMFPTALPVLITPKPQNPKQHLHKKENKFQI